MKLFLKLTLTITFGIATVVFIFLNTDIPNRKPNGFTRAFKNFAVKEVISVFLPESFRYIVPSYESNYLYLSGSSVNTVYRYSFSENQFKELNLSFKHEISERIGPHYSSYIFKDSIITVLPRKMEIRLTSGLKNRIAPTITNFPPHLYGVPSDIHTFMVQQHKNGKKAFCNWLDNYQNSLYGNCNDSLFASDAVDEDGQLIYDEWSQDYIYMYYYRNKMLSIDKNLLKFKIIPTIDTISNSLKGKTTGPLFVINQRVATYKGYILLSSNLKADNESRSSYMKHIPIDVYQKASGEYIGSFYIPLSKGTLVKSFITQQNRLIVLYHSNELKLFEVDSDRFIRDDQ